jgi:hypothetical protein
VTLTLDLPHELEQELSAEAARLGLPLEEYALRVLAHGRLPAPDVELPRTGADILAYWEREDLLGTPSEITDPAEHARQLRQRAERRFGT